MNSLIRKLVLLIFCAPAIAIAFIVVFAIIFSIYSFTFQYFDKFQLPNYAKQFPNKISKNKVWIDSVNSYSIEYRYKDKMGRGEISSSNQMIPGCGSIIGIEYLIDSNRKLLDSSFGYEDRYRGLHIRDSLFSCTINDEQMENLKIWKDRVRFLHDTLLVGKIWKNTNIRHFQFGADLIISKQEKSQYECNDGLLFNEIEINDEWKILRNCVTF